MLCNWLLILIVYGITVFFLYCIPYRDYYGGANIRLYPNVKERLQAINKEFFSCFPIPATYSSLPFTGSTAILFITRITTIYFLHGSLLPFLGLYYIPAVIISLPHGVKALKRFKLSSILSLYISITYTTTSYAIIFLLADILGSHKMIYIINSPYKQQPIVSLLIAFIIEFTLNSLIFCWETILLLCLLIMFGSTLNP
jgi:hypothetical protein